jgi:hypothetical protein
MLAEGILSYLMREIQDPVALPALALAFTGSMLRRRRERRAIQAVGDSISVALHSIPETHRDTSTY